MLSSLYCHHLEVVCDNPSSARMSLVILEDGVRSLTVEMWAESHLDVSVTDMALDGDKACLASDGDTAPPTKSCYSINTTISTVFSMLSPRSV